jgi:15-cis-phytoene synthase
MTAAARAQLAAAYRHCAAIAAEHGASYHLATRLLTPDRRPAIHALYAAARTADDLVDLPGHDPHGDLADWSRTLLAELDAGWSADPVRLALVDTYRRYAIPVEHLVDFLAAMASDLEVTGYPDLAALDRYMWGSAAVVGLQMLPILGRANAEVRWDVLEQHAIALGTAFQLTNFLRDVGEDLRRGRVYLPQESLDAFGVDRERLGRGRVDESIRNLLAAEIERARRLYRAADPGIDLVHPSSRDCLRTARTLYSEILDEIERRDYDVFHGRVVVGLPRRAQVALSGLRGSWTSRHAGPTTPTDSAS